MKKIFFLLLLSFLSNSCQTVKRPITFDLQQIYVENYKGIEVQQEKIIGKNNINVYSAEIPKNQFSMQLVKPKNAIDSSDKVSVQANKENAILAINGGFFSIYEKTKGIQLPSYNLNTCYPHLNDPYNALPARNLKINSNWFATYPNENGIVAWSKAMNKFIIDKIKNENSLTIQGKKILFTTLNKYAFNSSIVIYTDVWQKPIPIYKSGILLFASKGKISKIEKISNKGKLVIVPKDGFVAFFADALKIPPVKIGDSIILNINTLSTSGNASHLETMDYILSGNPILIKNNVITEDYPQTPFYINAYARSAICQLKNKNIMFLVVNGSDEIMGRQMGLSIKELSLLMLQKNCINAINLDGGHSAVFYFNNNILNRSFPKDEEDCFKLHERSISDMIIVK